MLIVVRLMAKPCSDVVDSGWLFFFNRYPVEEVVGYPSEQQNRCKYDNGKRLERKLQHKYYVAILQSIASAGLTHRAQQQKHSKTL